MRAFVLLASLVLLASCAEPAPLPVREGDIPFARGVASVDSRLVPNLRHPSPRIYSSGMPEGDEAFRELAALGIKTVISVDGEQPNVEAARKAGLRYVHLPVPYSGIPAERELEIAAAVKQLPGPVLIHCHHGKHRGPAAAAIARIAMGDCENAEAVAEMKAAGTDPHYEGLFSCVESFRAPTHFDGSKEWNLPERAPPEPLVTAMVGMDHRLDRLKAGKPDEGSFGHEALLLREALVEIGRADHEPGFKAKLADAVGSAELLEKECEQGKPTKDALARMERSCNACHDQFRDR